MGVSPEPLFVILCDGRPSGRFRTPLPLRQATEVVRASGTHYTYVEERLRDSALKVIQEGGTSTKIAALVNQYVQAESAKLIQDEEYITPLIDQAVDDQVEDRVKTAVRSQAGKIKAQIDARVEQAEQQMREAADQRIEDLRARFNKQIDEQVEALTSANDQLQIEATAEKLYRIYIQDRVRAMLDEFKVTRRMQSAEYAKARMLRLKNGQRTDTPCRADCWEAQGEVCQCSCAGENHSIAFDPERATQYRRLREGHAWDR